VIVCDPGTTPEELTAYLATRPLDGAAIALDPTGKVYDDYFVKAGFFGMPRVLLLDENGIVTFEGDPGLRRGEEWTPEHGPTYVDGALDKLLGG
jgi:hypothetical protein